VCIDGGAADQVFNELEVKPDSVTDGGKHQPSRLGNLRANPVTGKDDDPGLRRQVSRRP